MEISRLVKERKGKERRKEGKEGQDKFPEEKMRGEKMREATVLLLLLKYRLVLSCLARYIRYGVRVPPDAIQSRREEGHMST